MVGLATSLVSLVATLVYYNEERCATCRGDGRGGGAGGGDPWRFALCVASTVLSILFRVFLAAVLFSNTPFAASGLLVALYLVNFLAYGLTFPGGWPVAVVAAYASFFSPSGYAKNHGHHSNVGQNRQLQFRNGGKTSAALTVNQSFSEVERAKINQESLLVRVRMSHGLFALTSVLLLVRERERGREREREREGGEESF